MPDPSALSRYDLNLLVALDALLTERNVTRAAERLHLSQPAMSAALGRLRAHFDDPLLNRRGNTYELTPLAARLVEQLPDAVEGVRRVLESQNDWRPENSTREFMIYGSDYSIATVGAAVSRLAAEQSSTVSFRFTLHNESIIDSAEKSLRTADALLIPRGHLHEIPSMELWQDRWVAVCARDHPVIETGLTHETLSEFPWVLNYRSLTGFTSADRQLEQLGVELNVDVVAQGFAAVPYFLLGTRRLGLMQEGMVKRAPLREEIVTLELPYESVPLINTLWWHPIHNHDPAHRWLRSLFQRAGQELGGVD